MARRFLSNANGLVNLGNPAGLTDVGGNVGPRSIMAWLKPDGTGENNAGTIWNKGSIVNGGRGWAFRMSHGNGTANASNSFKIEFGAATIGYAVAINNTLPSDGKWRMIAGTYATGDGGPRLWIGDLIAAMAEVTYTAIAAEVRTDPTGTGSDSIDSAFLGNNGASTRDLNGELAFVAVFDNTLTLTQMEYIRRLFLRYNKLEILAALRNLTTAAGVKINVPGIYFFEEQGFVADYSGNRHNGTLTATQFSNSPFADRSKSYLPADAFSATLIPKTVILKTATTTHTPLPISVARTRMINPSETFHTPLPITVVMGVSPEVPAVTEPFTAANGPLGITTDHQWTRYGTRFQIDTNKLSFVGSAFGPEMARLDRPFNSDDYEVGITLTGWQRGLANDVAQGLIFRKDVSDLQTYYAIFVSQTSVDSRLQLWRFRDGQAPLAISSIPVASQEGDELRFRVYKLVDPTVRNRIVGLVANVIYIDLEDDKIITQGRYTGVHGYCEGNITSTVLQMDNLSGSIIVPPFVQPPTIGGGHKIKRNRRISSS